VGRSENAANEWTTSMEVKTGRSGRLPRLAEDVADAKKKNKENATMHMGLCLGYGYAIEIQVWHDGR
jgi:undecaprenyl pyrophosphate synthase